MKLLLSFRLSAFCPQKVENGPKMAKIRVFKFFQKLLFFWILGQTKIHFISLVPSQILYFGKFWVLNYESKAVSDCRILRLAIS